MIHVAPVSMDDVALLLALFDREHNPCFCRFWHFEGTSKEWEARCAFSPEDNRRALEEAIVGGRGEGLVARNGDADAHAVIGWLKLSPRPALAKLLLRAPYRGLDQPGIGANESAVLSIGCMLVDSRFRRRGVAEALVAGAIERAKVLGAHWIEAYPRVSSEPMHDAEAWMGPVSVFRRLGFEVARQAPQYPVLRRVLLTPHAPPPALDNGA